MDINEIGNGQDSVPLDISVALAPNNLDAVPHLLEEITAGVEALKTGGDLARHELASKARAMMLALEAPRETMIRHVWAQVSYPVIAPNAAAFVHGLGTKNNLISRAVHSLA